MASLRSLSKQLPSALKTTTTMDLQQASARAAAAQISYFRSIPWCAAHLSQPGLVIDQAQSRCLKPLHAGDTLISRTLNSAEAIPAYITFYSPPPPQASSTSTPTQPDATSTSNNTSASTSTLIREIKSFVALGPMVSGWPSICHGGLVVTLLDEVMGQTFAVNKAHRLLVDIPVMTGYLNTRFEKPVPAGTEERASVLMVTARLVRNEGRKYWMEGEVQGEDGAVLARAEALFIMLKAKL
ncbi:HotDog domain-containing protein [Chaetomium strumarium]|uniref:HotDog domain-containing protein n=1 Tax=Chaetomium strumarium TaxID=1170767 RepID=A0AAJ0M3N6_9PEZI|nr:HotDog domain-containing protein [Chaetomium strumarium]